MLLAQRTTITEQLVSIGRFAKSLLLGLFKYFLNWSVSLRVFKMRQAPPPSVLSPVTSGKACSRFYFLRIFYIFATVSSPVF